MKCVHNNVYLYNGDCRNVFNGIDSESIDPMANKSGGNVIGIIALVIASLRMAKLLWNEFRGK